jgi:PadR family transcriptional regulator, regulatory protein PadR
MRSDLMRGHLESLLLAALATAPGHGYEISRRLAKASGGEIAPTEGSIYPALHRLERGRLVTSEWSVGDGRRRRVYALTPAGRKATDDARREWRTFSAAIDQVMEPVP